MSPFVKGLFVVINLLTLVWMVVISTLTVSKKFPWKAKLVIFPLIALVVAGATYVLGNLLRLR